MARYILMFIAVAVFALLQIGDSLKCYHCASGPGGECIDPTKNSDFIRECINATNPDQVCYVRNITLTSTTELKRGCTGRNECNNHSGAIANSTCTFCEKDLCNSSPSVLPSTFYIYSIISAIIAKMYL